MAAASLLLVFFTDIFTPPQFGVDILYLCTILLVSGQQTKTIIAFAAVTCVLIIIDEDIVFLNQHKAVPTSEWVNRAISVAAILITSYIAVRYRKLNVRMALNEKKRLDNLNEMLFITSHKVRKPLANILGLIALFNDTTDEALTENTWKEQLKHLRTSADELDSFVNDLNTFLENSGRPDANM